MNKITDLNELGTEYAIYGEGERPITTVKLIWADEILASAIGEYNEMFYSGFGDYMQASVERLSGFVKDPYAVSWYCAHETDFDLHNALQLALNENNDVVIIEIITEDRHLFLDK